MNRSLEIVELTEHAEVRRCLEIQRLAWGMSELEVVPVTQLLAAQRAGGFLAGARLDGEFAGFSYGFPAYRPDLHLPHGLHSHMTAVLPEVRGLGLGSALKWFQRSWCLERGIGWIEWTFDPLRTGNARFNIERLGAIAGEYLRDAYGSMEDSLNSGLPSDRLLACWELAAHSVAALEAGERRPCPHPQPLPAALTPLQDGWPDQPRLDLEDQLVSVAVPRSIGQLIATKPEEALAWRHAVREAMDHYLARGYVVTRFLDNSYQLQLLSGVERDL